MHRPVPSTFVFLQASQSSFTAPLTRMLLCSLHVQQAGRTRAQQHAGALWGKVPAVCRGHDGAESQARYRELGQKRSAPSVAAVSLVDG